MAKKIVIKWWMFILGGFLVGYFLKDNLPAVGLQSVGEYTSNLGGGLQIGVILAAGLILVGLFLIMFRRGGKGPQLQLEGVQQVAQYRPR
jgi:hypothetical protein